MTATVLPELAFPVFRAASSRSVSVGESLWSPETTAELGRTSVSFEERRREILRRIVEAWTQSMEARDAYEDTSSVTRATVLQMLDFIDLLPRGVPLPEISAHADGELALYWATGRRRTLTLAIRDDGRVSYAALIGHRTIYGSDYFADSIPPEVSLALEAVLEN